LPITLKRSIQLEKYEDQTLSDEQIEEHGSLTRVVQLNPRDYESALSTVYFLF